MTPQDPTDEQAAQMMRETKIDTAVNAMADMMARVTGREEDAELIAAGYREMFAPKPPKFVPAMSIPPAYIHMPKNPSFFLEKMTTGQRYWDWAYLANRAVSVSREDAGDVWISIDSQEELGLEGAAAESFWSFMMEQYELRKAQWDAMQANAGVRAQEQPK